MAHTSNMISNRSFGIDIRSAVPAWAIVAAMLACIIPVFVTPILPLMDFYAHIARYYILAHIDANPALEEYYTASWKLLPNLGLDILGTGLMKLLPPLVVAQILGAAIVLAPLLGVLVLSRALHGYVTWPSLLLGVLLAFSHILIWGFANFLLGLGLGMAGLGFWISLRDRPALQLAVAIPLAVALFFVHGLAFAFWGLFLGCLELTRAWEDRALRPDLLGRRLGRLALLAVIPVLLFLQMPTSGAEGGITPSFANLQRHAEMGAFWPRVFEEILSRIDVTLRVSDSDHPWLDRGMGLFLWGGLIVGLTTGILRLDRRLWLACLLAFVLIGLMPPSMFSVGYLNDRVPLLLLALLAAGLSFPPSQGRAQNGQGPFSAALAALCVLHLSLTGVSWARDGQVYRSFIDTLAKTDTGPLGSSLLLGRTGERNPPGTRCQPLSFLMLLLNETAVRTFAFSTQQPLELDGALASTDKSALEDPAKAGYTAAVVCTDDGTSPPPADGFVLAAAHRPWSLYVAGP